MQYSDGLHEELTMDELQNKTLELWMLYQQGLAATGLSQETLNIKNAHDSMQREIKKRKGLVK